MLLRFLEGRRFDVELALEQMLLSARWRLVPSCLSPLPASYASMIANIS